MGKETRFRRVERSHTHHRQRYILFFHNPGLGEKNYIKLTGETEAAAHYYYAVLATSASALLTAPTGALTLSCDFTESGDEVCKARINMHHWCGGDQACG